MKDLRSILLAWTLLAIVSSLSVGENPSLTPQVSESSHVPVTNLGSNQNTPTQCIAFGKANSQSTPPELYQIVAQCIQNNDYPNAVALFVLAGMDTRFDVSRVADNTVGDTGNVLIMNTFNSIPATAKKKFNSAIKSVSTDNFVRDYVCRWVQQVGPPTYYPTYMIMHGMNAVTAGMTKTHLQQELLPVPDSSGKWRAISTSYLHCAPTEGAISSDAQDADRYRKAIERTIADIPASTAPGPSISSASSSTNRNGMTSDQQGPVYGPLTINSEGADFYVAQDGKFVPASVSGGTIEIHLHYSSFQIGYNGGQMNVCLAQSPFPEVRADPSGYKASCLAGPLTGAREWIQGFLFSWTTYGCERAE